MSTPAQRIHVMMQRGRLDEACRLLDREPPDAPNTPTLRAGVHMLRKEFEQARAILLGMGRKDYTIWYNIALCDYEMGDFRAAAAHHRRSLALNFQHAKGWLKLGAAHLVLQDWPEALACYERAVALDPADAELYLGLGTMMSILDDNAAAERAYRQALKLNPGAWEAEVALGFVLLRSGQWDEGWKKFGERWRLPQFQKSGVAHKVWAGQPADLDGKTILVICEQGYGDSFQFARYLPLVAARAARTYLVCPPALAAVMGEALPAVEIKVEGRDVVPEHDLLTSLMNLPAVFGTTLADVPPPLPYVARPRRLYGARVGVCWHGGARPEDPLANADDQRRSIPVEVFQPIIAAAGDCVSLQQEHLLDWGCTAWQDTADVVAGLDLVVTVDTAIAHLAASLGIETWVLCRAGGCWRWLSEGGTTVWYPSMRLFRQRTLSDWGPVVAEVAAALADRSR